MKKTIVFIFLWMGLVGSSGMTVAEAWAATELSPAAVGWGNLIVPGLGATLRGQPGRGLLEATFEIGTFYGGTFGVRESKFSIDGTIDAERQQHLFQPSLGLMLQQIGLKTHMFNTFYHYQQVCLEQKNSERERRSPQPLYQGTWSDVLSAPFEWKYLGSPWVGPVILGGAGLLIYEYATSTVKRVSLRSKGAEEWMYGGSQGLLMPLGSAFGEDVLFRGFVQREMTLYSNSVTVGILTESTLFSLLHENHVTSFLVGLYLGFLTSHQKGDLGYAIAPHFWLDVVDGLLGYFVLRRAEGKNAPLNPPVGMSVQIPF